MNPGYILLYICLFTSMNHLIFQKCFFLSVIVVKGSFPYTVLSLSPSFYFPDVLCDPTVLIWRKETPFEAMTDRTAISSDGFLAEVFWGFLRL